MHRLVGKLTMGRASRLSFLLVKAGEILQPVDWYTTFRQQHRRACAAAVSETFWDILVNYCVHFFPVVDSLGSLDFLAIRMQRCSTSQCAHDCSYVAYTPM
jgi:hypothetical protein